MLEMPDGEEERPRVWPGIAPPLGLTAVLILLAWLFALKLEAEKKAAERAGDELAARARLWAKTVLAAAEKRSTALASARLEARRRREGELRLETRSLLDAAHRLLAPLLDKAGPGAAERRRVGAFPSGLDAARTFLETTPAGERGDPALAALRAFEPELAALLPADCHLSVVEDYSRELLSRGGIVRSEKRLSVSLVKEFTFNDGTAARNWAIRVETSVPDDHPPLGAAEMAERLAEPYPELPSDPDGVSWRGWLIGPEGREEAVFPLAAGPPLPSELGKWTEVGDDGLAWLEAGGRSQEHPWRLAVAAAINRPGPPPEFLPELWRDDRWGPTLALVAFFSLAGWIWFLRGVFSESGGVIPPAAASRPAVGSNSRIIGSKPTLIPDPSRPRSIPDVPVILADINDQGEVTLRNGTSEPKRVEPEMPFGSLSRLQSIHRGGPTREGSRILDQARSPVLRELANRVRPPSAFIKPEAPTERRPAGRAATRVYGSRTAIIRSRLGRDAKPGPERQEPGP